MGLQRTRWLLTCVIAAAVYAVAARAGFALAFVNGEVSSIWPATGFALVLLVIGGPRLAPAILLGETVGNLLHGSGFGVSLVQGIGDVAEAYAGYWLLRRLDFRPQLDRLRDVFALLIPAALVSTLIGATVGTLSIFVAYGGWDGWWETWHTWWLGDAMGELIAAPLLFSWVCAPISLPRGWRALETAAFGAALVAVGVLAYRLPPGMAFLVMPVLIWGALRFGLRGASLASTVLATAGVSVATRASSDLAGLSLVNRLLFTQDFLTVAAVTALVLAAVLAERRRALDRLARSERHAQQLADEQASLARVATAVARETDTSELCVLIAAECGAITQAQVVVLQHDPAGEHLIVAAAWAPDGGNVPPIGQPVPAPPDGTPVRTQGRDWGLLSIDSSDSDHGALEPLLERYAELLTLGLVNAAGRAALMARASTDPLTGLANHRAFHERLADELGRAQRYGRPLSVAMLDVDNFKQINDSAGHHAGDEVLVTAAHRIASAMRAEALVARLGGDELGIVMPECTAADACRSIARAQRRLARAAVGDAGAVTVSAGVCDTSYGASADELLALADGALYWAKSHGRGACIPYSPEQVRELSDTERADRLLRTQAKLGLRAVAAAIDARDPATARHSEGVAQIAAALARVRGWPAPRIGMLREAALVHDVGKLGIPDAILGVPRRLTQDEYEQAKRHAALGADIVSEILDPEQVGWVRGHHEQPDGRGYPDGLSAAEIPEGAALLAIADAWEVMTAGRSYRAARGIDDALAECERLAGVQFTVDAVDAMRRLRAEPHALAGAVAG